MALAYSQKGDLTKGEEHVEEAKELGFLEIDQLREAMKAIKAAPLKEVQQ
ncbi:hypothetical protein NYE25_20760 [Paenibacillus sp. FSL E2-8871]